MGLLTTAAGIGHLGSYPQPAIAFKSLSAREAHIYQIIGQWLIPPNDTLPGHGGDAITLQNIDDLIAEVPEATRTLLSALPLAFEHGSLVLAWGSRRMSDMDATALDTYLRSWMESTLTAQCQLVAALKTLYGFAYYERTDVLEAIQIPGVCTAMATVE